MTTMNEELDKLLRTMECYNYDADEYKGRHAVHSFAAMLATVLIKNDAHLAKGAHEWQPIETAPRDGTLVLLCTRSGQPRRTCLGKFTDGESRYPWRVDQTNYHLHTNDLTHWMPLPAAPMLSQRGGGVNTTECLSELMRGLEIPPSATTNVKPQGFYAIGAAIAAQAKQAEQRGQVREGWKLVPIEPTDEMWKESVDELLLIQNECAIKGTGIEYEEVIKRCLSAMLAAAPDAAVEGKK